MTAKTPIEYCVMTMEASNLENYELELLFIIICPIDIYLHI